MIVRSPRTFSTRPQSGNLLSTLFTFIVLVSLTGCGGGGGGGGGATDNPVGPSVKPDAVTLNLTSLTKNQVTQVGFSHRQLALTVPADGSSRRYGVVITAENPVVGNAFRLLGNGGGGTKLPSLRAESLLEPNPAFPNQAAADAVMRGYRPKAAPAGSLPRAAVRAANTSAEKVGDEITFNAYSGGYFGSSYTTRKGVLRRRGQYCKIFVDPDAYQGLSAVNSGPYQVTEADLDVMQTRFDQTIYPFITQNYGNTYDKDADGRVTIFLSPLYTRLGFAGLFDPVHLSDRSVENVSNERDMFVIFTPDASFNGQTWQKVALETICHEFQHLANYVARRVVGNKTNEDAWLDEALPVGADDAGAAGGWRQSGRSAQEGRCRCNRQRKQGNRNGSCRYRCRWRGSGC